MPSSEENPLRMSVPDTNSVQSLTMSLTFQTEHKYNQLLEKSQSISLLLSRGSSTVPKDLERPKTTKSTYAFECDRGTLSNSLAGTLEAETIPI